MATNDLIAAYEKALAAPLESAGETRFSKRLFAHAVTDGIWRGVWITFNSRKPKATVQPNLGVFCPAADGLVRNGLAAIYGPKAAWLLSRKLGGPIITHPLYDVVGKLRGEDRKPFSYDVSAESEIPVSVATMVRD